MEEKKRRPGGGRKAAPEGKRVNFTVMIAPATREKITRLRARGVTIGRELDNLVDMLYRARFKG